MKVGGRPQEPPRKTRCAFSCVDPLTGAFSVDEHSSAPSPVADDEDVILYDRETEKSNFLIHVLREIVEGVSIVVRDESIGTGEKDIVP